MGSSRQGAGLVSNGGGGQDEGSVRSAFGTNDWRFGKRGRALCANFEKSNRIPGLELSATAATPRHHHYLAERSDLFLFWSRTWVEAGGTGLGRKLGMLGHMPYSALGRGWLHLELVSAGRTASAPLIVCTARCRAGPTGPASASSAANSPPASVLPALPT